MTIYERRQCTLLAIIAVAMFLFTASLTIAVVRSADDSPLNATPPAATDVP